MRRVLEGMKGFVVVAGSGEGNSELTAFDAALIRAGIANCNLLKLSSILPPGLEPRESVELPPGSMLPVVLSAHASSKPGEVIAAAVAVGWGQAPYGIIMENRGAMDRFRAEKGAVARLREGFALRGLALERYLVRSVDHQVRRLGCVVAAVAFVP
ncbi:MAG: arginine decarboxylase, pyruvoyl-dependent [Acetobacteraceae bacterium]|nr:arginine decarboxylase, pyruvoyl-dependent [Acetobacteraceae bacterium]